MAETLAVRLARLARAEELSREAHDDDVTALHRAIRDADEEGKSVRWVASHIGKSVSHTGRLMAGICGKARD